MRVRFGFAAMSMSLKNASPSGTMTYKTFQSIQNREAALDRATGIADRNLHNTLRILRHARASGIFVYRFSSRLIPLLGHPDITDWDFISKLKPTFEAIGGFVRTNEMRVSFHPEHFTVLNSPKASVVENSISDLANHVKMFDAMGLDEHAKLVLHVGGGYKDKDSSLNRFVSNWEQVPTQIRSRITLENDDKTFTATETQGLCERLRLPNVFDVHHHACNHKDDSDMPALVANFLASWQETNLPPKAHMSSPKNPKDFRAHADYVSLEELLPFLDIVRNHDVNIDVMLEAKQKDEAVFRLMEDFQHCNFVKIIDGAVIEYRP